MQEADLDSPIILEPKHPANAAVIWLHGLGADGYDFVDIVQQLNLPDGHGIRFVFPHARVQAVTINGGMQMRSWYDIRSMDFLEDVDAAGIRVSCYQVYDLIQTQIKAGIAADKIVIAGFSQGGLIALHAGLSFELPLAGILALSTYCPMVAQFHLHRQMPIMMMHGDFDRVIPFSVALNSYEALAERGYPIEWRHYPMEHQVCRQEIADIAQWLQSTLKIQSESHGLE